MNRVGEVPIPAVDAALEPLTGQSGKWTGIKRAERFRRSRRADLRTEPQTLTGEGLCFGR
jgi:hypothetical protein